MKKERMASKSYTIFVSYKLLKNACSSCRAVSSCVRTRGRGDGRVDDRIALLHQRVIETHGQAHEVLRVVLVPVDDGHLGGVDGTGGWRDQGKDASDGQRHGRNCNTKFHRSPFRGTDPPGSA